MGEWKEYKLSEVGEVIGGGTPSTEVPEFWNGEIAWLTPRDLSNYSKRTISEGERNISKLGLENSNAKLMPKGTVLLSSRAPIGYLAIAENVISTNQGFQSIVPNAKTTSDFLYYLLKNNVDYLISQGEGTTFGELAKRTLKELSFTFPPISEQRSIASILSSLDDKIDLLHRQNKTLEALAETLFRQWFVEDKIWDGKLSEYIKIQGGYAFKSQDFREVGFAGVLKITNISMGSVDIINTQFVDEEVVKNIEEEKFRAKTGDFLIAMTGAEIGKIGIIEKISKQVWVNQRVGKLVEKVPYGNIIGYLALKSREGQDHIINSCSGSAQENISSSGIEEMDFVPYLKERADQFGSESKPLFEKIIFNKIQILTLTQLRDTLLPKLMSGEVRVKN